MSSPDGPEQPWSTPARSDAGPDRSGPPLQGPPPQGPPPPAFGVGPHGATQQIPAPPEFGPGGQITAGAPFAAPAQNSGPYGVPGQSYGVPGQSYGVPGQFGPPPGRSPQQGPDAGFGSSVRTGSPRSKTVTTIWTLGLLSLVALVAGLSIDEDGRNAWSGVHAWGALALVGAALTLAPAAASATLGAARAAQLALGGAGALVLFWVLFTLPAVGSNTSLVSTIGVAAGLAATWLAPGRESAVLRPGESGGAAASAPPASPPSSASGTAPDGPPSPGTSW